MILISRHYSLKSTGIGSGDTHRLQLGGIYRIFKGSIQRIPQRLNGLLIWLSRTINWRIQTAMAVASG